jgi:hypothetical protein
LQQYSGAVACERVCAYGASMGKIFEDFQALKHDIMAFAALDMRDKTDPAGIVFVARIVQTLFGG